MIERWMMIGRWRAPLSSKLAALPGNVFIPAGVSGLPEHSVLNVTQIATIARGALEAKISAGHDWLLAQIDTDLTTTLGLTRP